MTNRKATGLLRKGDLGKVQARERESHVKVGKGGSRRSEATKRERDEEYAEMMASASAEEVKGRPHCQRRNCGAFGRGLKGRGWRGTAESRDSARVGSSRFAER